LLLMANVTDCSALGFSARVCSAKRLNSDIRTAALGTVSQGRRRLSRILSVSSLTHSSQLHEVASASQALIHELKDIARDQLLEAKLEVPAAMTVRELSICGATCGPRASKLPRFYSSYGSSPIAGAQEANVTAPPDSQ
jgi:hypothetical protein